MVTRDNKVVDFPNSEERARRLKVEVERLARQSPAEWLFWLDDSAKKHGIEPGKLKAMIEATVRVNEKAAKQEQAEKRQREQRAERERTAAHREEERQQREQRREQERADREAERKRRERDKALAEISQRPLHEGHPDRRGPRDRDGRDLSSRRAAHVADAARARWLARRPVENDLPALRSIQGCAALGWGRVGLPRQGLPRPLLSLSASAKVVSFDRSAYAVTARACAMLAAELARGIASGAD